MKEIDEKDLENAAGGDTIAVQRADGSTVGKTKHPATYSCDKFEYGSSAGIWGTCGSCVHGRKIDNLGRNYYCELE